MDMPPNPPELKRQGASPFKPLSASPAAAGPRLKPAVRAIEVEGRREAVEELPKGHEKITEADDPVIKQQAWTAGMIKNKAFPNAATEMFYRLPLSDTQRKKVYEQILKSSSKKDSK